MREGEVGGVLGYRWERNRLLLMEAHAEMGDNVGQRYQAQEEKERGAWSFRSHSLLEKWSHGPESSLPAHREGEG